MAQPRAQSLDDLFGVKRKRSERAGADDKGVKGVKGGEDAPKSLPQSTTNKNDHTKTVCTEANPNKKLKHSSVVLSTVTAFNRNENNHAIPAALGHSSTKRPSPGGRLVEEGSAKYEAINSCFRKCWGLKPAPPEVKHNPSPNPISLGQDSIATIRSQDYVVCEKSDGVRYSLLLCRSEGGSPASCMVDRSCRQYEVTVYAESRYFDGTLLDGELVWENDGRLVYWVFDVACIKGQSVREKDYMSRFRLVQQMLFDPDGYPMLPPEAANQHARALADDDKIASANNPHSLCFRPKQCFSIQNMDTLWHIISTTLTHKNDGLIFTPVNEGLPTGTFWNQFKWKRENEHTIDFQLRGKRGGENGGWIFGLYYVVADFSVAKAEEQEKEEITSATYLNACQGISYKSSTSEKERVVYFLLSPSSTAIARDIGESAGGDAFSCIVECMIKFLSHASRNDVLVCDIKCIRSDKMEPNNRYTIRKTIPDLEDAITYEKLRTLLTGPPPEKP